METNRMEELTHEWKTTTWQVIELKEVDVSKLQRLFSETYSVLCEFRNNSLVPKEISSLLLEMHDFSWWVSDLEETPLHRIYQTLVSLVADLTQFFLTNDYKTNAIEKLILGLRDHSK